MDSPEENKLRIFMQEKGGRYNILKFLLDSGTVQSKYLCNQDENIKKKLKIHLGLDTNHDFKIKGASWERELFNKTPLKGTNIAINNPDGIADFFFNQKSASGAGAGAGAGAEYNVYVCLDAVSMPNSGSASRLGLFNTPIRWWDGGADSDHLLVPDDWTTEVRNVQVAEIAREGAVKEEYSQADEVKDSQENIENIEIEPPTGANCKVSPLRVHKKPKVGELQLSTGGQNSTRLLRDLNWRVPRKFMNIHNFDLPCLHYKDYTYQMILNLDGDNFELKLQKNKEQINLSLNDDKSLPFVNCVSCTQVIQICNKIISKFLRAKKKISIKEYVAEMKKTEDTKSDYWNIKKFLDRIQIFFEKLIEDRNFTTVDYEKHNHELLMLLLFFLFNLKRSGDQAQIEVVYILQKAYELKEFVFLTLDSHAAKIARDVYNINVGLLSADKRYFTCYKRLTSAPAGAGAHAPAGATVISGLGTLSAGNKRGSDVAFNSVFGGAATSSSANAPAGAAASSSANAPAGAAASSSANAPAGAPGIEVVGRYRFGRSRPLRPDGYPSVGGLHLKEEHQRKKSKKQIRILRIRKTIKRKRKTRKNLK